MRIDFIIFYIMWGIECLLLIPFILNRQSLDRPGKWIFYYLISSVVFALGSRLIGILLGNNLWFFAIMYLIQFYILSIFYYLIIKSNFVKQTIKILLIPAAVVFLLDFLKLEGIYTYNSIFASIRTLLLLCYGMIFFLQLLFDNKLVKDAVFINTLPAFWYNAGLFIYHSAFFLFSLSYNFFLRQSLTSSDAKGILSLSYIAGIIQLILFYIGLMKAKKLRS